MIFRFHVFGKCSKFFLGLFVIICINLPKGLHLRWARFNAGPLTPSFITLILKSRKIEKITKRRLSSFMFLIKTLNKERESARKQ